MTKNNTKHVEETGLEKETQEIVRFQEEEGVTQEQEDKSKSESEEKSDGNLESKSDVPKGLLLKQARESKGISLETIHEETKIPMDALRAIEEGYTIRSLSPFYLKGFLKIYAKYLDIDVTSVVEDYRKEELPEPIERKEDEFDVWQWVLQFLTPQRKQQLLILLGIFATLYLLFFAIVKLTKRKPVINKASVIEKATNPTVDTTQKVNESPPKVVVEPKVEAPQVVDKVSTKPSQAIQKEIMLTVRAKKSSWLRIKVDGKVVFQSTLRVGAVETWTADEKIEISGKNINELEFDLNGKLIGSLGRKDRAAKEVIITKDGLAVTK